MTPSDELPDPQYPDRIASPATVLGLGEVTESWELPMHSHRKAQLLFADTGLITLQAQAGLWVVPPQGAVWIPGGMLHRARCSGKVRGFVAFVEPDAVQGRLDHCCTLSVSPFMRALMEHIAARPEPYQPGTPHARLIGVLLDELISAPLEHLHLPMPEEARLRRLADAMLLSPKDHSTLGQWARRIGMSERNMSRLFLAQTGLSIHKWRRKMHVVTALPLLAQGRPIQSIADELGYDSAAAFVTMFRKTVGAPPRRFLMERYAHIHAPLNVPSGHFHDNPESAPPSAESALPGARTHP